MNLDLANELLTDFHTIINTERMVDNIKDHFPLSVGIDLGTSSIVLVVLNHLKEPIFGASEEATVVRDGLVVNYIEAVQIVNRLKEKAEQTLKTTLTHASGAVPPGTIGKNHSVFQNIIESTGMEVVTIVDEPTAAARVLKITDGHVVDIGGGTTGIASFYNGEVVQVVDEPTGGTHMTLVLAGHYDIPIEQAEQMKRQKTQQEEIFHVIRPVVEKMADITRRALASNLHFQEMPVYIVGGASNFPQFKQVFENILKVSVYQPVFPELVTPLGIALSSQAGEQNG